MTLFHDKHNDGGIKADAARISKNRRDTMRNKYKIIAFLISLLCIFMVPTFTHAKDCANNQLEEIACLDNSYNTEAEKTAASKLPLYLITIEDEAFEGTAITTIILPENVETIGDYAFADIKTLRNISIPNRTTYIGKNAFKGSNNVTITGAPKGYARAWAHENGIPFSPITSFYAFNYSVQINGGLTNSRVERLDVDSEKTEEEKPKPTDRMTGELNAEKKETITAFHIQGRSPPME